MPLFAYRIQLTRPGMIVSGATPVEDEIIDRHFAHLKDLAARGVVVLAGRTVTTDPAGFGLIVFNAESPEAAAALVAGDPAVAGGVMRADLYPYRLPIFAPQNFDPASNQG
jgi:uncharacterized protein YciI